MLQKSASTNLNKNGLITLYNPEVKRSLVRKRRTRLQTAVVERKKNRTIIRADQFTDRQNFISPQDNELQQEEDYSVRNLNLQQPLAQTQQFYPTE